MRQHRAGISQPGAALCLFWWLHRLPYHISHRIRCLPHHVWCGVGVGAEGEARAVVSQGTGQGFHIHPVLQRERCEGVPEIMEPDVLRTDSLEDLLVGMPEGVRIKHPARLGRREHVGIPRMLLVLLHQQIHRLLRDRQDTDGIVGLGLAHHQFSLGAGHLLRDGDGSILHVQVCPEEGQQFSPSQSRGQLQVEGCQQAPLIRLHQIGSDLLFRQDLHLPLLHLRQLAASGGVHQNQPL